MSEEPKIKICGLMTEEDCRIINRYRPDFAGFVFADTRHRVTDEEAAGLREKLDPAIDTVGVFVDEPTEHIAALLDAGTIQLVQLHGREDDAYIARLRELIMETVQDRRWRNPYTGETTDSCPIIRAARVRSGEEIAVAALQDADFLLLDAWDASVPGGSGREFDKKLLGKAVNKPWFLAGGLKPDNLASVLRETREAASLAGIEPPFAVDVSSGVESDAAGGHKDEKLVAQFIDICRSI